MKSKNTLILTLGVLTIAVAGYSAMPSHKMNNMQHAASQEQVYLKAEVKTQINEEYTFKYNFAEKPQMGTVILKVVVSNSEGKQVNNLNVVGNYDMPSMAGHHASGDVAFQQNKKGDYLMPVNLVMPGIWEINLMFKDKNETIYEGRISIEI